MGSQSYLGYVFIEGSSTAAGYGDEERRFGYAGRIFYNYAMGYRAHSREARDPCTGVVVHSNGMPDNKLPQYVLGFPGNVRRGIEPFAAYRSRRLGMFLLNSAILPNTVQKFDAFESFRVSWRNALEDLHRLCDEQRVAPILFAGPRPDDSMQFNNGSRPDMEASEAVMELNRRAAKFMEAPYLEFEDMIGGEDQKAACMSHDTIHPNALGHTRVAYELIAIVNRHLDIPEELGVFPNIIGKA